MAKKGEAKSKAALERKKTPLFLIDYPAKDDCLGDEKMRPAGHSIGEKQK